MNDKPLESKLEENCIARIARETIQEMEASGAIENAVRESVKNTIFKVISDALTGYSVRKKIIDKIDECTDGLINSIGLDSYSALVLNAVKSMADEKAESDARKMFNAIRRHSFLSKKDYPRTLDGIIQEYEKDLDLLDEEEKRRINEDCGGYLCRISITESGFRTRAVTIELGQEADCDPEIIMRFTNYPEYTLWRELILDGSPVSIESLPKYVGSFRAMIVWMYATHASLSGDISPLKTRKEEYKEELYFDLDY
jgi:hypothetical protein